MKLANLTSFIRGWLVGSFSPNLIRTKEIEVGIKRYKAGDYEQSHYHKLSTEMTIIVSGQVEMNGTKYSDNDIVIIEPNEKTDFKCLTDVITVVIRNLSVPGDKYTD